MLGGFHTTAPTFMLVEDMHDEAATYYDTDESEGEAGSEAEELWGAPSEPPQAEDDTLPVDPRNLLAEMPIAVSTHMPRSLEPPRTPPRTPHHMLPRSLELRSHRAASQAASHASTARGSFAAKERSARLGVPFRPPELVSESHEQWLDAMQAPRTPRRKAQPTLWSWFRGIGSPSNWLSNWISPAANEDAHSAGRQGPSSDRGGLPPVAQPQVPINLWSESERQLALAQERHRSRELERLRTLARARRNNAWATRHSSAATALEHPGAVGGAARSSSASSSHGRTHGGTQRASGMATKERQLTRTRLQAPSRRWSHEREAPRVYF